MLLAVLFVLGVANFAMHKAVIASHHPALESLPELFRRDGGRFTLVFEFVVLLAAMLLTANGWPGTAWFYATYSVFNAVAAWLMLSDRV
jgi:Trk-type K+ transport system membrane component